MEMETKFGQTLQRPSKCARPLLGRKIDLVFVGRRKLALGPKLIRSKLALNNALTLTWPLRVRLNAIGLARTRNWQTLWRFVARDSAPKRRAAPSCNNTIGFRTTRAAPQSLLLSPARPLASSGGGECCSQPVWRTPLRPETVVSKPER